MECSTNARLLFIGLWNFCDDAGIHKFSPKQVKAEIFPGDSFSSENILGMIDELIDSGLLILYSEDGTADYQTFLYVTGWERNQRIDKPQSSVYPLLLGENQIIRANSQNHSTNVPRPFLPDRMGREGIGKDRKGLEEPIPSGPGGRELISDLAEAWNKIEWVSSVRLPLAESNLKAGRHGWACKELHEHIKNPTGVIEAIQEQREYLEGNGWFRFSWLFKADKSGERNLIKLMDRAYKGNGNGAGGKSADQLQQEALDSFMKDTSDDER